MLYNIIFPIIYKQKYGNSGKIKYKKGISLEQGIGYNIDLHHFGTRGFPNEMYFRRTKNDKKTFYGGFDFCDVAKNMPEIGKKIMI